MGMDAYQLRGGSEGSEQTTWWWLCLRMKKEVVGGRERDRRVLSSVSLRAVPLLFFVNTLARSHCLAKSASVSGQSVFKSKLRFLVPTISLSIRLPLISPTHMTQITSEPIHRARVYYFSLTSPWSQKWPRQVLSINLVWASRYASLLYPYPCLSLEKNDALEVHATPHGSLAWQSSGLPVKI
jgi:hypothetical protein